MGHRVTTVSHSGWVTEHTYPPPAAWVRWEFPVESLRFWPTKDGMTCPSGNTYRYHCNSIQFKIKAYWVFLDLFAKSCALSQRGKTQTFGESRKRFHVGIVFRSQKVVEIQINGDRGKGISKIGKNMSSPAPSMLPNPSLETRECLLWQSKSPALRSRLLLGKQHPLIVSLLCQCPSPSWLSNSVLLPRGPRLRLRAVPDSPSPLNYPRRCQWRPCFHEDLSSSPCLPFPIPLYALYMIPILLPVRHYSPNQTRISLSVVKISCLYMDSGSNFPEKYIVWDLGFKCGALGVKLGCSTGDWKMQVGSGQ